MPSYMMNRGTSFYDGVCVLVADIRETECLFEDGKSININLSMALPITFSNLFSKACYSFKYSHIHCAYKSNLSFQSPRVYAGKANKQIVRLDKLGTHTTSLCPELLHLQILKDKLLSSLLVFSFPTNPKPSHSHSPPSRDPTYINKFLSLPFIPDLSERANEQTISKEKRKTKKKNGTKSHVQILPPHPPLSSRPFRPGKILRRCSSDTDTLQVERGLVCSCP